MLGSHRICGVPRKAGRSLERVVPPWADRDGSHGQNGVVTYAVTVERQRLRHHSAKPQRRENQVWIRTRWVRQRT
jgi:hypothetical protein